MAYESYLQESETVGLVFIITNGYIGNLNFQGLNLMVLNGKKHLRSNSLTFAVIETSEKL